MTMRTTSMKMIRMKMAMTMTMLMMMTMMMAPTWVSVTLATVKER